MIKQVGLSFLTLLMALTLFGQGFAVGGGAVFVDEAAGPNGRFYYFPDDYWCFGMEASYFPSHDEVELSFNGHYLVEVRKTFSFYPIAGLRWSANTATHDAEEKSTTGMTANLGLGLHVPFGRLVPYTEYIHGFGFANSGSLLIGTFFIISEKRKHD